MVFLIYSAVFFSHTMRLLACFVMFWLALVLIVTDLDALTTFTLIYIYIYMLQIVTDTQDPLYIEKWFK